MNGFLTVFKTSLAFSTASVISAASKSLIIKPFVLTDICLSQKSTKHICLSQKSTKHKIFVYLKNQLSLTSDKFNKNWTSAAAGLCLR